MKVEDKKVEDLIPYAMNSRTHDETQVAQIASSIKEFGFTNPILIDEDSGIIAGHGRILAAKKLGFAEVPCIVIGGLTKAQKKAYVIADNQLALNAGWDLEMLKLEIESLKELDFDIDLLGIDEGTTDLLDEGLINDNQEIDLDDFEDVVEMKLKFSLDDFNLVSEKLRDYGETKEEAIMELLKLKDV